MNFIFFKRSSILILIFSINLIWSQPYNDSLSNQEWLEDLDFLVNTLKTKHYKPYTTVSEKTIDSLANDIKLKIKGYSEEKIISEFSKLTALLRWGHTRFSLPVNNDHLGLHLGHKREREPKENIAKFSTLPLRFVKFSEGVFVESTTSENYKLLGKKLTHIGEYTVEEAIRRVSSYIAYENESALNLLAPSYLSITELLYADGIINSKTSVTLKFKNNDPISIKPIAFDDDISWIDYLTQNKISKPKWLKNTDNGIWKIVTNDEFYTKVDQYYWYDFNAQDKSFYIKINYLFHHPEKSLAIFMNEAIAEATEKNAEKIILDLRHNRGGSSDMNRAIKLALQRWPKIADFGNVFVIMGRHSYSASIMLAMNLEKDFNVIFLGEDMGGKPKHIGDSQRFRLPNSGLTLRVSVREHHDWTGLPDRPSVWLHYKTPLTFNDYKKGIDASLQFAKNYQFKNVETEIVNIYKKTNINAAILIYYHLLTDPISAVKDYSGVAFSLAKFLYEEEDRGSWAQSILLVNLEYYTKHIPSLLLLGEIQMKMGDIENGKETLTRVLTIDPDNKKAKKLLEI